MKCIRTVLAVLIMVVACYETTRSCLVSYPAYERRDLHCEPSDGVALVNRCDNDNGRQPLNCTWKLRHGVSGDPMVTGAYFHLLPSFMNFGEDSEAKYDWGREPLTIFTAMRTVVFNVIAEPGENARMYQVVGYCGPYTIFSSKVDIATGNSSIEGATSTLLL